MDTGHDRLTQDRFDRFKERDAGQDRIGGGKESFRDVRGWSSTC